MSGVGSRGAVGRIGISLLIAVIVLILTSFFDARPNGGADLALPFDVPAGGPWCGPSDGLGTNRCRYLTFEQCLAAVSIVYGTCRPNPAAVVIDEGPYRTYRSIYL